MATSVLGKRSRRVLDAEDITCSIIPARKRRARYQEPQIYEDEENLSKATRTVFESVLPRQVPCSVITKHNVQDNNTTCNSDTNTWESQDENIPPFITATPTTNRIKDVLGLTTPQTPKHRVRLAGSFLTPRKTKPVTTIPRPQNGFALARQLFTQSSNPATLVGRDAERRHLQKFITDSITARTGGCTYISGPPGTGKSALVQKVFEHFEEHEDVDVSIINCISLKSSTDVYGKLIQDFVPGANAGKTSSKQFLTKLFLNKSLSRRRLLLLDEVDSLVDTDCDVLYTVFEWALQHSSSLILVGIANALDLTDRFLPRLKSRGLKPELLPFLPYNATQISNIISDKLTSLLPEDATTEKGFVPFLHPTAIQLCGKKIASQTGDLRKAFGLVRRILDQLEKETMQKELHTSVPKQPLGEVGNVKLPLSPVTTPEKIQYKVYSAQNAPRASIAHVARIASSIFNNGTVSRLSGLNLQQKAVLCSLVGGEQRKVSRNPYVTPSKSSNRVPTVKDLFAKYTILCQRDEGLLQPLKDTEFRDVVASLETLGLIHEYKGRTCSILTPTSSASRSSRSHDDKHIISAVSEKEMRESLEGAGADLLRRLLDEV